MSLSRAPFFALGSFAMLLAAGCSSSVETTSSTTTSTSGGTTSAGSGGAGGVATGGSTATSGGSGTGGDTFDGGAPLTTIESGIGPIAVASGEEHTQCITLNLKNAEGAFVRRFRADLGTGSHHMIVYKSSATTESLTPKNCQGFSGLLTGSHPIFIAQQAKAQLDFPTDDKGVPVGFEIAANQMVKIELHFIDTGAAPLNVTGKLYLDTVPLATNVVKSDLAFWGTTDVNIPANGTGDTGMKFQAALPGTNLFALTTHQHQLGTEMRVWRANDAATVFGAPIADGKNWSDPPLELFTPALSFQGTGDGTTASKGLAYQCTWKNTTAQQVGFGEGFNDEMCFLWQYYYPSQGFQLCIDGNCKGVQ